MKILLSLLGLLVAANFAFAQSGLPVIEFETTSYDYGTIKEEAGPAKYLFTFKNSGDAPLILKNVQASCSCTKPVWKKEPIAPGATGTIEVGYNPLHRPGSFKKTIKVITNGNPPQKTLTISGTVTPRQKTKEELYPRKMDIIRWKTNYLSFGKVVKPSEKALAKDANAGVKTGKLFFYNASDTIVNVVVKKGPGHIKVDFPVAVAPKTEAEVDFSYDASKKKEFGHVSDRIYLSINGNDNYKYSITVSANLSEDFTSMSAEELANAPICTVENKIFDFGTIVTGEKKSSEYIIKNEGKSDMFIRRVKTSCGCTAAKPSSNIVKPGESVELGVTFNSRGKSGRQNKTITLITNDPKNTTTILRIMGTVTK